MVLLEQEMPNFTPPPPHALAGRSEPGRLRTSYGVLQELSCRTNNSNVDELKRRIKNDWTELNRAIVERAVGEWRQRLYAQREDINPVSEN